MTRRPRRNHGAAFKAKVALEAIKDPAQVQIHSGHPLYLLWQK